MTDSTNKLQKIDPTIEWQVSPEGAAFLPTISHEPDLTNMPLSKAIFHLAGPAMTSMLLLMTFNLVDAWWVGRLGAEPFAGVSAASFIVWALQSVGTLVSSGVTAMVARFVGAKEPHKASLVAGQGVILSVVISLLFGLLSLTLQKSIFEYMGLKGSAFQAANQYLFYIAIGLCPQFLFYVLDAAFRGMGNTMTPLKIIAAALVFNAVLDPFLIFGIGPFPRMEAAGAALATVIAHILAAVMSLILIQRKQVRIRVDRQLRRFIDLNLIWRIVRIGAPIAFSGVMFSTSYMFLTEVITQFGSGPLAALGLGHRIEGLAFFAAVGFSVAAETLVGQHLGANKPESAAKAAWLTIAFTSVLLGLVSICYYFFAQHIIGFFISDPAVISEGIRYLKIIAIFEVFLGFEIVFEGAFSGAGNSVPPMAISVPVTWLRIPLAILLAEKMGMGSEGIWWAIGSTTAIKGILLAIWFKRGRWKTKKV
jgi:putative MATE family efflux protein